jgi:Mor family transcriptional regulator
MMPEKYDWVKKVDFEKFLTKDMRKILDVLGSEAFFKLCECHDGRTLYIPSDPLREAKKEYAIKYFDGSNAKELAKELDVTTRTIYRYLDQHRQEGAGKKRL